MTNGPYILCDKCGPSGMVTDRCDNWLCGRCFGHLPVEQSLASLTDYVKILEEGLMSNSLHVMECGCCKNQYVGVSESCRCSGCCLSCQYNLVAKAWLKGRSCPSLRGK